MRKPVLKERVSLTLDPELVARIDLAAKRQPFRGKRSRVVAQLIREGVTNSGQLVARKDNA